MRFFGKTLSFLLALLLTSLLPLTVFAQDSAAKEETIYAKLHYDGSLAELYVVNSFELSEAGPILDYGTYSTIRNLSTTTALTTKDGEVRANAPAGRFYYEGKMETALLPWDIKLWYLLDGQEIKADALAGKSGALLLRIEVKQNPNAQKLFFENHAMQISLSLDSQKCSAISAKGAVIANAGKNKSIHFMLLPGSEKSFTVQANVTDFEMDGILLNGTVMAIDFEFNNREQLTEGFKDLQGGIGELNDGVVKLKDGSKEYKEGIGKFAKETGTISGASSQIESGLNKVSKGMKSLVQQTGDLKELALSLQNNIDPRVQGLAKGFIAQYEAMAKLSGGLSSIASQYGKMDSGIHKVNSAAKKLSTGYGDLNEGIEALFKGTTELKESTSTIDKDVNKKIDEMISDFTHSDYTPVSFVSAQNTNVQSVQFVIRTDPISLPEKEKKTEEESVSPKSFFERLIALFAPKEK